MRNAKPLIIVYNGGMTSIRFISLVILASFLTVCIASVLGDIKTTQASSEVQSSDFVLNDRVVRLEGEIDDGLAEDVNSMILELSFESNKIIYMIIDSPGGSIMAGRAIVDVMNIVKAPIYCQVKGSASSMAAMILMHCDHKIMLSSSYILFHQPSMKQPNYSQVRELQVEVDFVRQYWKELCESTSVKMGMTYEQFYNQIDNTWILTAQQAKNAGLIDHLVTGIVCQKSFGKCSIELYPDLI